MTNPGSCVRALVPTVDVQCVALFWCVRTYRRNLNLKEADPAHRDEPIAMTKQVTASFQSTKRKCSARKFSKIGMCLQAAGVGNPSGRRSF
jgi:hypothetical protein